MAETKRRVLIIEDESLVAMLIEDILLDLGYEIAGVVGRLSEALALTRDVSVDLVILDLNLHGVRTDPVAELLAARGVPIVFATGYGASGLEAQWAGRPVVQKPFQPAELERAIAAALAPS